MKPSKVLISRLRRVKLFLCDVDGVLTDGRIFMGDGKEYKAFSIQDGLGMLILQSEGIKVESSFTREPATRGGIEDRLFLPEKGEQSGGDSGYP